MIGDCYVCVQLTTQRSSTRSVFSHLLLEKHQQTNLITPSAFSDGASIASGSSTQLWNLGTGVCRGRPSPWSLMLFSNIVTTVLFNRFIAVHSTWKICEIAACF